jgi:phosphohistidine phosphatase
MKTLILVRHAKSSWDEPHLADYERKLNNRGLRDAPFMGAKIKEKNVKPDLILSSPAVRAFKTACFFAEALDYPIENIVKKELIYEKGPRDILNMINQQDDNLQTIMLFGHNPDLSTLTHYLCDFTEGNLPTCGTVCIDFNTDSWVNVGDEKGKLRFYENPKKYFS